MPIVEFFFCNSLLYPNYARKVTIIAIFCKNKILLEMCGKRKMKNYYRCGCCQICNILAMFI